MPVIENTIYWLLSLSPFIFAGVAEAIDDSKGYWQYLFLLFSIVLFLILITTYGRYFYSSRFGASKKNFLKANYKFLKGKIIGTTSTEKTTNPFWKFLFFPGWILRRFLLPYNYFLLSLFIIISIALFGWTVASTTEQFSNLDLGAQIGIGIASSIVMLLISIGLRDQYIK
jgi:hypothetical protein